MIFFCRINQSESSVLQTFAYLKRNMHAMLYVQNMVCADAIIYAASSAARILFRGGQTVRNFLTHCIAIIIAREGLCKLTELFW